MVSSVLEVHVPPPTEEQFVEFYRAHWPGLVAALAWSVPPEEDPEDVAQEAFVRAYRHWPVVSAYERPEAWLFVTAYRLASSLWRRRAVRRRREVQATGESEALAMLLGALLSELMGVLTPRQRAALLLRHYYGLSTAETARALGCREGTVKSLLSRGREAMQEAAREDEG